MRNDPCRFNMYFAFGSTIRIKKIIGVNTQQSMNDNLLTKNLML
jgi:hypothetical protein